MTARPTDFDPDDPPSEESFRRWYHTVSELRSMAQSLGIPSGGTKSALTERIAAQLAGRPLPQEPRPARHRIPDPLTVDSVIPAGVILDRRLRNWFVSQLGPQFHSYHHLRSFLRHHPGATLGDALDHWHATRHSPAPEIGAQFEYNRFVRRWRAEHPGASHAAVVQAWQAHRAKPADDRLVDDL